MSEWWEAKLETLLTNVGLGPLLSKIGGTQVLDWVVATLDFAGKTFLADIRARRADNPDLKEFLQHRIIQEEADNPDLPGTQRLENIIQDPATWQFIVSLGLEDLKASLLATLVSVYHYEMEPVLPEVANAWRTEGKMFSPEDITQRVRQQAEETAPTDGPV